MGPGRVPLGRWDGRWGDSQPVARLAGVRLSYDDGATWALDGLDLTIGSHERVAIMGANGSGKSTLARVLAGLSAPDEGRVELLGRLCFDDEGPREEAYRHARRHSAVVFQNPEDQIVTTVVADDVAFGPENLGLDPEVIGERVDLELRRVAMEGLADADATRLSGGQTQRVAIAGGLAMEPAMLIFDEAAAYLDVRGRDALLRLSRRLQALCAQVWISHRAEDALAADRVVILSEGRILAEGTPSELLADASVLERASIEPPFTLGLARSLAGRGIPVSPTVDGNALAAQIASHSIQGRERTACAEAAPATTSRSHRGSLVWDVDHVGFRYGSETVLDDVSLQVREGETLALIGPTGSGKSTLSRLLCGLVAPSSGTVRALGHDLATRAGRRCVQGRIGYAMQRPERQLFAETVTADVGFGPANLELSREEVGSRVEGAMDALGIAALGDRSPFALSGGQQRLAALAGIVALAPRAWVLDEPLAGLDGLARTRMEALIERLAHGDDTLVLITHDMDQAARADRVVVLDGGHVALEGSPREVFAHGERLRELGLGVPEPLGFARRLLAAGLDVGSPLTAPALLDAIARAVAP